MFCTACDNRPIRTHRYNIIRLTKGTRNEPFCFNQLLVTRGGTPWHPGRTNHEKSSLLAEDWLCKWPHLSLSRLWVSDSAPIVHLTWMWEVRLSHVNEHCSNLASKSISTRQLPRLPGDQINGRKTLQPLDRQLRSWFKECSGQQRKHHPRIPNSCVPMRSIQRWRKTNLHSFDSGAETRTFPKVWKGVRKTMASAAKGLEGIVLREWTIFTYGSGAKFSTTQAVLYTAHMWQFNTPGVQWWLSLQYN